MYYSVAVKPSYRKYLRFSWRNALYQFICFPNGLSSCPRTFTKLLKPPLASLHKKGHIVSSYTDDLLVLSQTYSICATTVAETFLQFDSLGFTIHPVKSVFLLSQRLVLLGFLIESVTMTVTLTPEKSLSVKKACASLLEGNSLPTIREVPQVIGKLIASFPGVMYGPLHYRSLKRDKTHALKGSMGNFHSRMALSPMSWQELD